MLLHRMITILLLSEAEQTDIVLHLQGQKYSSSSSSSSFNVETKESPSISSPSPSPVQQTSPPPPPPPLIQLSTPHPSAKDEAGLLRKTNRIHYVLVEALLVIIFIQFLKWEKIPLPLSLCIHVETRLRFCGVNIQFVLFSRLHRGSSWQLCGMPEAVPYTYSRHML